jgi:hypothetical protein
MFDLHEERRCEGRVEKLNETNDRHDSPGDIPVFVYFSRVFAGEFRSDFRHICRFIAQFL